MSQVPGSYDPVRPLSIGNVLGAGILLYRSHLKQYFALSVRAYLWVLLPVYGWAKFFAISALISRLAFRDLVNQPESANAAHDRVNQKLWGYLVAALLVGLRLLGVAIGLYLLATVAMVLITFVAHRGQIPAVIAGVIGITIYFSPVALLAAYVWIYSRYLITELPLAIEDNVSPTEAISRSWQLTKGFVMRLPLLVLVANLISVLITFPVIVIAYFIPLKPDAPSLLSLLFSLPFVKQMFLLLFVGPGSLGIDIVIPFWQGIKAVLYYDLPSLLVGVIVMPFWQGIKAVLYYDLVSRREGLDL